MATPCKWNRDSLAEIRAAASAAGWDILVPQCPVHAAAAPSKHPMQPVELVQGVARFKRNVIIDWLFNEGVIDLNVLATMRFPDEDHMQLAQLLGYSVAGFGDLSYADPIVVARADVMAAALVADQQVKGA